VAEKGKESVGNVKLDLRFRGGGIYFIFLIVEMVYLIIMFRREEIYTSEY